VGAISGGAGPAHLAHAVGALARALPTSPDKVLDSARDAARPSVHGHQSATGLESRLMM